MAGGDQHNRKPADEPNNSQNKTGIVLKMHLKIVSIILGLLGGAWVTTGIAILCITLAPSSVYTILNTIKLSSCGLGCSNIILAAFIIVIGIFKIVYAIPCFNLAEDFEKIDYKPIKTTMTLIIGIVSLLLAATVSVSLWCAIEVGPKIQDSDAKDDMVKNLHKVFTEDSHNSANMMSNSWNKLFIELDCCAVNPVESTTNDFDFTPWCTTSGECQQTNSQIPKTCCIGVTESTYSSAPSTCHANVDSGTYKANGCYEVLKNKIYPCYMAVIIVGFQSLIIEVLMLLHAVAVCRTYFGICDCPQSDRFCCCLQHKKVNNN